MWPPLQTTSPCAGVFNPKSLFCTVASRTGDLCLPNLLGLSSTITSNLLCHPPKTRHNILYINADHLERTGLKSRHIGEVRDRYSRACGLNEVVAAIEGAYWPMISTSAHDPLLSAYLYP
jgi:hypothetical protein